MPFLPLLPEVLEDPYEAWMSFEQHLETEKVVLRQRLVKVFQIDKERGVLGNCCGEEKKWGPLSPQ